MTSIRTLGQPKEQSSAESAPIFHKPCAFQPNGVSRTTCQKTSALLRSNPKCCETNCASKVRACHACLRQGGVPAFVVNPNTGLCAFHEEKGVQHERPSQDLLVEIEHHQHKHFPSPEHRVSVGPQAQAPPAQSGVREATPDTEGITKPAVAARTATVERVTPALPRLVPPPADIPVAAATEAAYEEDAEGDENSPEALKVTAALERAQAAIAAAELLNLDPTKVRRMPNQPRKFFDQDELKALAESMKQHGQLQPGLVRPIPVDEYGNTHEIVDCERRWLAAQMAGIPLRAMSAAIDDEAAAYLISVGLNFNRSDHTPMEISDAIVRMSTQYRMTHVAIGKLIGYSPVYIGKFRKLQRLVPAVRALLNPNKHSDRAFPFTVAVEIAELKSEVQHHFAQQYLSKEISLLGIRKVAQDRRYRSPDAAAPRIPSVAEQWRDHAISMEILRGKLAERNGLMERTPQPSSEELSGRLRCITEMRNLHTLVLEGLAILNATLQPKKP